MELNEEFDPVRLGIEQLASPSPALRNRRAILVVGVHRSGTSALARVLSFLGCDLPKHVMPPLEGSNELGFWEPEMMVQAHETFFAKIGSSWDDVVAMPDAAFTSEAGIELRQQLMLLVQEEYGASPLFVVKDPRISRLLPLWFSVLTELGVSPASIISVRNPLEVAASLRTRDGFTATKSFLLWLRHTLEAELYSRNRPRSIVMYDELLRDWHGALARVGEDLGIKWPSRPHRAAVQIDKFLSDQHRHHSFDWTDLESRADVVSWVKEAYFALRASDPVPVLDEIRVELARADDAYGPIVEEARLALEMSEQERDEATAARDALAAALAEREAAGDPAENAAIRNERDAFATELGVTREELERLTKETLRFEGEATAASARVGELEGELGRYTAEIERFQAEAVSASSRAAELEAEIGRYNAEIERVVADAAHAHARVAELEEATTAERRRLLTELETARADGERLSLELAETASRAESLADELGVERTRFTAELDLARTEIERHTNATRLANERLATIQSAARARELEVKAREDAAQAEHRRLVAELDATEAEVGRLGIRIAAEIAAAESKLAERDAVAAELKERLAAEAAASQSKLAEREAVVTQLNELLAAEIAASESKLAEGETVVTELNELLALAEAELEASAMERDRLAAEIALRETEEDELLQEVIDLESALETARAEAAEFDRVRGQLKKAHGQLEAARTEISRIGRERDAALELVAAAEDEGASLREERDGIAHDLDVLRSEAARLQDEVEASQSEMERISGEAAAAETEYSSRELEAAGERADLLEELRAAQLRIERLNASVADVEQSLASREMLLDALRRVTPRRSRRRRTISQLLSWLVPPTPHKIGLLWKYFAIRVRGDFDADLYLMRNPDVARAGLNPLLHYLEHGEAEGRNPATRAPSVKAVTGVASAPVAIPEQTGVLQTEEPAVLVEHLAESRELADAPIEALGSEESPQEGSWEEYRELVADDFDQDYYLGVYPDVEQSGIDPLQHYLETGWREGRDPSAAFSTAYYLRSNPDVEAVGMNPLAHYVLAGRSEGRTAYPPGGFRDQVLETLRPLHEQVAQWRAEGVAPLASLDGDELRAALAAGIGTRQHVVLACSHDDYTQVEGGVQLCVALEEEAFAAGDYAYVNLHPAQPLPILSPHQEAAAFPLMVLCDGERIGIASAQTVIDVLGELGAGGIDFGLVVHALHGHSPEVVAELHAVTAPRWAWLWLHDFFAICPSGTLLRNKIAPCGAPPVDSPACGICVYGEERLRHVPRVRALLDAVPFNLVAPSEFMADSWRAYFGDSTLPIKVHPHGSLVDSSEPRPERTEREMDGPIRVAFLGVPAVHKGWGVFSELARRLSKGDFEFFHFGDGRYYDRGIVRREVRLRAGGALQMIDALRSDRIDIALIWSLCGESYSFTAHEALAAGAAILTNAGSGNVARVVSSSGAGVVFDDEASLYEAFESGDVARLVANRRHDEPSTWQQYVHGGLTADFASLDE